VHPWLADHTVGGRILLPGTAFVELVIRAGDAVGCGHIVELALEAPLVLPATGGVQVQVTMASPDRDGKRQVAVYGRAEDTAGQTPWTRHASGLLSPPMPASGEQSAEFAVWPPEGATPVPVTGLYEELAARGYQYGPAFRGMRAAWRRGTDVFAEVSLPQDSDPSTFGIHPALLDAALHAAGFLASGGEPGEVRLPFAWTGVQLHAVGASVLRVRLRPSATDGLSLAAADGAGKPVVSVASLVSRPVAADQLATGADALRDALFTEEWVPVPAADDSAATVRWAIAGTDQLGLARTLADARIKLATYSDLAALADAITAGESAPDLVLTCAGTSAADAADVPGAALVATERTLCVVQQ
jgi:acyl transferase domain-containing protein